MSGYDVIDSHCNRMCDWSQFERNQDLPLACKNESYTFNETAPAEVCSSSGLISALTAAAASACHTAVTQAVCDLDPVCSVPLARVDRIAAGPKVELTKMIDISRTDFGLAALGSDKLI